GPGLAEHIYREAMHEQLTEAGHKCVSECELPILFNGKKVGSRFADLLVDNQVVVELKVVTRLNDDHEQQLAVNVRTAGVWRGLLFNFGGWRVTHKRWVNPEVPCPLDLDADASDDGDDAAADDADDADDVDDADEADEADK
ncbi:MAG: GxxExxY protein, partial [Persicimonas sp.]